MITINLLPSSIKREYQLEIRRRLIMFYSIGFLVIISIFIGLLFSFNLYFGIQNESLDEQIAILETSPKSREIQNLEFILRDFSTLSKKVKAIEDTLVPLHPLFRDLQSAMPAGVKLNDISLDREAKKASITGFAVTRDNVIAYKENLKKLSWVKGVESPLSNLIKEQNIDFNFNLDLNLK